MVRFLNEPRTDWRRNGGKARPHATITTDGMALSWPPIPPSEPRQDRVANNSPVCGGGRFSRSVCALQEHTDETCSRDRKPIGWVFPTTPHIASGRVPTAAARKGTCLS